MSTKLLTEQLEDAQARAAVLAEKMDTEVLSEDETREVDELLQNIEKLKADIQRQNELKANIQKKAEKKAAAVAGAPASKAEERELDEIADNYRLMDVIRHAYGIEENGRVAEMHKEGENEISRIGESSSARAIVIPYSMLSRMKSREKRANIAENDSTGITTANFVQSAYARTVLGQLGATFIEGVEDVRVPIIGAVSTQWEGETDAAADGGSAMSKKDLTPIRMSGFTNFSKQLALQANYSIEGALRSAFEKAVAAKFDYACFTDDSGNGAFNYLGNGKTPVEAATALEVVHGLIEEVLGNNYLPSNPMEAGFAITHTQWSNIMEGIRATGVAALMEDDRVSGYPFAFSTQIADVGSARPAYYFGDWSYVWAAQFGGMELILDNLTEAVNGMDKLVLNTFWDMELIQANAISVGGYTGA